MRILRINSWDGPGRGGAEEYIRTVADALEQLGHPNRIVNITDVVEPHPREDENYLRIVPMSRRARRLPQDLRGVSPVSEALEREIREFSPDLIQVHHFEGAFTSVARVLRRQPAPILVTAHDAWLVCPIATLVRPGRILCEGGIRPRCQFTGCRVGLGLPYNLWQKQIFDAWVAPRVRAYLAPSRSLAGYLHDHAYRPSIHLPSFAALPESVLDTAMPPPAPDLPPTIGWIGRMESYKGVEDLLRAFPSVRREHPDARLSLAGGGSRRPALKALARELGVADAVEWAGVVRGAAKEEWFRSVHVVAVPSNEYENFPLVALEALARCRPVVGTAIGGIPEIVQDGVDGRIVPIADPPSLARALAEVLENPERAREWATHGRQKVLGNFTAGHHVARLVAVYEQVLGGGSLPSRGDAEEIRREALRGGRDRGIPPEAPDERIHTLASPPPSPCPKTTAWKGRSTSS